MEIKKDPTPFSVEDKTLLPPGNNRSHPIYHQYNDKIVVVDNIQNILKRAQPG